VPEAVPTATEAVAQLYAAHYSALVRLGVLLLRDQAAAEDVVQDAFCELHRRWPKLRDHEKAAGYLRTSVVNRSRSVHRRRLVAARHTPGAPEDAPGADVALTSAERRGAVLAALAALPERQREVLALRYYLDLSEQQIAEMLGISRGSVKTHASRAAAALRASLEEHR
jgi:RNA polymerase sigma-70 factor (sigma-E family)